MTAKSGSGASTRPQTREAVEEAIRQGMDSLAGGRPAFGLIFASPKHRLGDAIHAANAVIPGVDFAGCTTAGEITERGLTRDGVAILLVADNGAQVRNMVCARGLSEAFDAACGKVAQSLKEAQDQGAKRGLGRTLSVLLVDGLGGSGEPLLRYMQNSMQPWHHIVGGAAGDDGMFKATHVGTSKDGAHSDSAVVLNFVGRNPWGIGIGQGLMPRSEVMKVTRAQGNVLYEIDGRPAFDVYSDYARSIGTELTRENAGEFMINHELGVYWFERLDRARAPISVNDDGSLVCAAEIGEQTKISIIDGQREDLVSAARNAALEARDHLEGREAAAVLMFDCICRGTILKEDFGREIDAVSGVFPGVPIAGFLTYGEIARYKGPFNSWHNTTVVIAAIPR